MIINLDFSQSVIWFSEFWSKYFCCTFSLKNSNVWIGSCQIWVKVCNAKNCFLKKFWNYWQILVGGGNFEAIEDIGNYCRPTLLTQFQEIVQNNCENPIWRKNMHFFQNVFY